MLSGLEEIHLPHSSDPATPLMGSRQTLVSAIGYGANTWPDMAKGPARCSLGTPLAKKHLTPEAPHQVIPFGIACLQWRT